MDLVIYFKKLTSTATDPQYFRGGYKIYSDQKALIDPQSMQRIKTGISVTFRSTICFLRICSQGNSLASNITSNSNTGLRVSEETIPDGYPNELRVFVYNFNQTSIRLNVGDCIAQVLVLPLLQPKTHILDFHMLPPFTPTEQYLKWREWYFKVRNTSITEDDITMDDNTTDDDID